MDLGFGNGNQRVGTVAESLLLQSTKAQEQAVEQEINRYDALLNDDAALEVLRSKRLQELKDQRKLQQQWKAAGHGTYEAIGEGQDARDVGRAFFDATKASDRVVVHFYRPTTRLCDHVHAHLSKLAPQHPETRFLKMNVESGQHGGGFLVEQLGIHVLPTILIVRNNQVVHHVRGFDELGGTEHFSTKALEYVLGVHDGVQMDPDAPVPAELVEAAKGVNQVSLTRR